MGWFSRPLAADLRPREYGTPDHFILPSHVELDSTAYPEFHGVEDGPSAVRSNSGELFQAMAPEYAGQYELGYLNQPGTVPTDASLYQDLAAPRDAGGVPGTNRTIHSIGPVDGTPDTGWSGSRTALHAPQTQSQGPVTGGPDYGQTLTAAYYSAAQANFSQAQAESAMVAAQ
jgi:hypothetical protein